MERVRQWAPVARREHGIVIVVREL